MTGPSLLVVVPARGGSKRFPYKNVAPLDGKPLILYTLEAAKEAGLASKTYVSTDDAEVSKAAESAGISVIKRPPELARDDSTTESVLLHALETAGGEHDWVMTLPPTSPLRTPATIRRVIGLLASTDADCVMTVTKTLGDFWRKNGDSMTRLFPDAPRTQKGRDEEGFALFDENSAVYCTRVAALKKTGSILGSSVAPVEMDIIESVDINTEDDLRIAEALLQSRR